jgi:general secretion pathway protein G
MNQSLVSKAHAKDSCPRLDGFTLLELLVVMVIIGLLAAYVGPRYFAQIGKSEQGAARAQIEALAKALLDTGSYPSADKGLNALMAKPADEPKWQGPYLQKSVPLDPWGKPYVYKPPSPGSDFDLLSYGKDGQPGGDAENADVSYR